MRVTNPFRVCAQVRFLLNAKKSKKKNRQSSEGRKEKKLHVGRQHLFLHRGERESGRRRDEFWVVVGRLWPVSIFSFSTK